MLTWNQLGIHVKPVVLVNVDGFFDGFLAQLDRAVADRLLTPANRVDARRVVARRCRGARRRASLAAAARGAEVVSRSGAATMKAGGSARPPTNCANVRGVFADIDDTITSDGRLTAEAYAALAGACRRGGLLVVPITGTTCRLVRPHRAHVAGRRVLSARTARSGCATTRASRKLVKRFRRRRRRARARIARRSQAIGRKILAAVPGAALASDQHYRETRPRDRLLRGRDAASARATSTASSR